MDQPAKVMLDGFGIQQTGREMPRSSCEIFQDLGQMTVRSKYEFRCRILTAGYLSSPLQMLQP